MATKQYTALENVMASTIEDSFKLAVAAGAKVVGKAIKIADAQIPKRANIKDNSTIVIGETNVTTTSPNFAKRGKRSTPKPGASPTGSPESGRLDGSSDGRPTRTRKSVKKGKSV